ncbi:hypothetical protein OAK15_04945 [Verrucomicrobia bacterium]|nr:hypothetical protein [Verrucomicrobiota bacterium]
MRWRIPALVRWSQHSQAIADCRNWFQLKETLGQAHPRPAKGSKYNYEL